MEKYNNNRILRATRVTVMGLLTNLILAGLKIVAGIAGKSSAIIADAVHSLSDLSTDVVVILGMRAADKPADNSHDYGHGKFETLSTAAIGIILFAVAAGILWSGIHKIGKLASGQILPPPGAITLLAALTSIIIKEWLYRYTVKVGESINSQAVIVNAWHHRSDAFSSIGVAAGIAGAIFLGERWRLLDPLVALIVSAFIIKIAVSISFQSIGELLERSLSEKTKNDILKTVTAVPGVKNPHKLKTRRIGDSIAIDIHIEVDQALTVTQAHDIATKVENKLREVFGRPTFVSVHVEPFA